MRRFVVLFVALLTTLALTVPAAAAPGGDKGPKEGTPAATKVKTASDKATDKIHPNLKKEMDAAPANKQLQFVARIVAGTDLGAYADAWFARPTVDPLGSTVASGYATAGQLMKMASDLGVISLQRAESLTEVPKPIDPDVEALNASVRPEIVLGEASPGPAPEGWYSTGDAIHGSQSAWDKGYTGEGVRYMSNDSGADYCHADLDGTWAYIDDPSSPYFGLPEMFDSISSYMTAFDFYLGTDFIASGEADYADTSTTVNAPAASAWGKANAKNKTFSYRPIGASENHTYVLPGTSRSGIYHVGSHPDNSLADNADLLSFVFGDDTAERGERAAILVVDANQPQVYDTVYVDINYNYDFTDDEPARLGGFSGQETACLDYDDDGLNDVSGGLVYFISDGKTSIPTQDWFWGIATGGPNTQAFKRLLGNGNLVAFHVMDFVADTDHGMGTTSVAVGQGVTVGSLNWGPGGSPIANYQGLVVGPGKDVESTQNGDQYLSPFVEDAFFYAALGYDGVPGTGDDIQIVSNSFGYSGTDNDGFDYESRLIDSVIRALGPWTSTLWSTGNGAAGYGTAAPPSPSSGIGVGASTLYGTIGGSGGFEAIDSADQIVGGDPMSWSNRGPGARNVTGAEVVATGAFGTGSVALNEVLWGAIATESFGGTSMASPVAAGNLALIYDAYRQTHGTWPTWAEAKALLMGTATDTDHDVWTQGAGLVNADLGTDAAAGAGAAYASPASWSVGDFRGTEYEGFAHIIEPGGSDTQSFTIANFGGAVTAAAKTHDLIGSTDYSFTSLDQSMDHGAFTTPDYVFRIDEDIPPGTDLLEVKVTKPYDQFNPTGSLSISPNAYNNWRVHLQNWTDLDSDGEYWIDVNGNGKVDLTGEMETGEHIRFTYGYDFGPSQQARIANLDRIDDGLLLTFRHRNQDPTVPTTDLTVAANYWQKVDWDWVTVGLTGSTLNATINVPAGTPFGMYEGSIEVTGADFEVVIPVTVAVAAAGTSFEFGGVDQSDLLYDNGAVFGYNDYSWRAEAGDWRFFWTDIAESDLPAGGTGFLVVDNDWEGEGTDIDTIIMGPTPDGYSPDPVWGPYTLEQVGRSNYTYVGSGRWGYDTSSGGSRELISAPIQEGLHGIFLHEVRQDGANLADTFSGSTGLVTLDTALITGGESGNAAIGIESELDLNGFVAEGFGLSAPSVTTETASQDDPNDPSSASVKVPVTMSHAGVARISTAMPTDDLDLFLVYDADSNGVFTNAEIIASSTTGTSNEFIEVSFPADGDYEVWVQGWSVTGNPQFTLTIDVVQGFDISVDAVPGSIPAGGTGTVSISWDIPGSAAGTYYGVLLFGPAEAPGLFSVPVEVVIP